MSEFGGNAKGGSAVRGPIGLLPLEGESMPESELIRRAPTEPGAFAALYRRHVPAIQRYLSRRLGDPHLVEDAVAETFVSALKQIHRFEDRGVPFRSWLYRIATGEAHRQYKRASRLAMASLEHEPEAAEDADSTHAGVARAALLQIAPKFQTVLALHYLEGLSVKEVARTLKCREGTVKSRLSRARAVLRVQLEKMGVTS